jgi:Pyruvate/2-oxoacid:ferredoxin oxidoreductase gamma subunit
MGSIRSANIALIGYSVGTGLLPFKHEDLKDVLESTSWTNDLESNVMAFETGFNASRQ